VFKLTGDDTGGALDYFICEVAPHGDHRFTCTTTRTRRSTSSPVASRSELAIRSTPSAPAASPTYPLALPHAFLNLTDQPAELIIVFAPGGGHKFFEELGPATRTATFNRDDVAAIFERHGMTLLSPPLSAD
jgi:hypothetical protein